MKINWYLPTTHSTNPSIDGAHIAGVARSNVLPVVPPLPRRKLLNV